MSTWLRVVLAIVVAAHGLGHILFLVSLLGIADWGQPAQSWLLGGGWLAKGLGTIVWLVAFLGFAVTDVGILLATDWWQVTAILAAVISAVGLILFWVRPAGSPLISALVFDLLVLAALVVFQWPPITQMASR